MKTVLKLYLDDRVMKVAIFEFCLVLDVKLLSYFCNHRPILPPLENVMNNVVDLA